MAAISFREETSELRVTEVLADEKIKVSCEDSDDQFAYAAVTLDKEDMVILRDWLSKQIEKLTPVSNG